MSCQALANNHALNQHLGFDQDNLVNFCILLCCSHKSVHTCLRMCYMFTVYLSNVYHSSKVTAQAKRLLIFLGLQICLLHVDGLKQNVYYMSMLASAPKHLAWVAMQAWNLSLSQISKETAGMHIHLIALPCLALVLNLAGWLQCSLPSFLHAQSKAAHLQVPEREYSKAQEVPRKLSITFQIVLLMFFSAPTCWTYSVMKIFRLCLVWQIGLSPCYPPPSPPYHPSPPSPPHSAHCLCTDLQACH